MPRGLEHLWDRFCALSSVRSNGMSGPSPIGWSEIAAYAQLNGLRFEPWEVSVIKDLDNIFLNAVSAGDEEIGKLFAEDLKATVTL